MKTEMTPEQTAEFTRDFARLMEWVEHLRNEEAYEEVMPASLATFVVRGLYSADFIEQAHAWQMMGCIMLEFDTEDQVCINFDGENIGLKAPRLH